MGNSLFNEYEIEKNPFLKDGFWKIYKGTHKESKRPVSIFFFDKKELNNFSEKDKENILLCLRKDAESIIKGTNQHKNFLNAVEKLNEDSSSIGFVTEELKYNLITWIAKENPKLDEIKIIFYQIFNCVNFMHKEYKISHNNLNPFNIFINTNGFVKISGFNFISQFNDSYKIDKKMSEINQNIQFLSPEILKNQKINQNSDLFSIGLIMYYLKDQNYINNPKVENKSYEYFLKELEYFKINKNLFNDDEEYEIIKKLLEINPKKRINLNEILNSNYFNFNKINYSICKLYTLENYDITENYEFLKQISKNIQKFSLKEINNFILPNLLFYIEKEESLLNPIIPILFNICDKFNEIKFEEKIWPNLKEICKLKQIPTVSFYYILNKMSFINENISNEEFNKNFLPLIFRGMECGYSKIQCLIFENLLKISNNLSNEILSEKIYVKTMKILAKIKDENLQKLIFEYLNNLISLLDKNFIINSLFNDFIKLLKVNSSYFICYEIINLINNNLNTLNNNISKNEIKNKLIPVLLQIIFEGEISIKLFKESKLILNNFLNKIEKIREKNFIEDKEISNEKPKIEKIDSKENLFVDFNNLTSSNVSKNESKSNINIVDAFSNNESDEFNLEFEECKSKLSLDTNSSKNTNNKKINENVSFNSEKINNKKESKSFFSVKNQEKPKNLFDNLLDNDNDYDEEDFNNILGNKNKSSKEQIKIENIKKNNTVKSSFSFVNDNKEKKTNNINHNNAKKWEESESEDDDELLKEINKKEKNGVIKNNFEKEIFISDKIKEKEEDINNVKENNNSNSKEKNNNETHNINKEENKEEKTEHLNKKSNLKNHNNLKTENELNYEKSNKSVNLFTNKENNNNNNNENKKLNFTNHSSKKLNNKKEIKIDFESLLDDDD